MYKRVKSNIGVIALLILFVSAIAFIFMPVIRDTSGSMTMGSTIAHTIVGAGIFGSLCLLSSITQLNNRRDSPTETEPIEQTIYTKNDEQFSNTLYQCQNDACSTRFFRMYQVFDAYKKGEMRIPGDNNVDEKSYAENFSPDGFAGFGLVACPSCHAKSETTARSYNWMKTEPAFPYLDLNSLYGHREAFYTEYVGNLNKMLNELSQKINHIEEVGSYQHYYGLNTPHNAFVQESMKIIHQELETIVRTVHLDDIKQECRHLINRLHQLDNQPFDILIEKTDSPKKDDSYDELNKILESAKAESISWMLTQKVFDDDPEWVQGTPKSNYERTINRLQPQYKEQIARS